MSKMKNNIESIYTQQQNKISFVFCNEENVSSTLRHRIRVD